jgi:hypothetical protein
MQEKGSVQFTEKVFLHMGDFRGLKQLLYTTAHYFA